MLLPPSTTPYPSAPDGGSNSSGVSSSHTTILQTLQGLPDFSLLAQMIVLDRTMTDLVSDPDTAVTLFAREWGLRSFDT
jgi:hypothetical protein